MELENIKFKAKQLNSGKWVEGDLLHRITDTCIAVKDMDDIVYYPVDPDTVCQFTGFLDKKGKEVYEKDVLRSDIYPFSCVKDNAYDNYYGILGWSEQTAVFYIETVVNPKASVSGISHGNCDYISQDLLSDFEVIGSVHDKEWQEILKLKSE